MYKNKNFDDFLSSYEVSREQIEEKANEWKDSHSKYVEEDDLLKELEYSIDIGEDLNNNAEMDLLLDNDTLTFGDSTGAIAITNDSSWSDSTFTISSSNGSSALEVNPDGDVRIDGNLHLSTLNKGELLENIDKEDSMNDAMLKMNAVIDTLNELISGKSQIDEELDQVNKISEMMDTWKEEIAKATMIPKDRLGTDTDSFDALKDIIG